MKVKVADGAFAPSRAHQTDAGLDFYAIDGGIVPAHDSRTFHTGVAVELPEGTAGIFMPKSGLMVNHDILVFGVVDHGYDGEVLVHMFNLGSEDYTVLPGDKIAQMLVMQIVSVNVEQVDEITGGERGSGGFGSTGR